MFEEMIVSYIEDLRSNLLLLNECLISIQNGQHDTEIVNSVFRVAHTIKGNSAAMEFTKIEKVMHTMEDVLQDVRSGKREMSQDIIDVLFASHDFLEDCLDIINSTHTDDSLDVDDILAKITLVEQGAAAEPVATTPPSMEVAPVIIPDFPFTLDASHPKWQRILDNFEDGFPLYWLKVHLDEECQMKPVRSWLVLDKVNQHAELIASLPPHPGENAYEEGSMEFAGFTINLLAITDRDIEDLTEELQRTIDVVGVSKQELQHDDIMPSTSIPAEQNAQQLMTEVGIALLKCEQTGCDKETLDQLIQLLYRLGAVTVEGVSQVFPAAIDGILTALQEMHDRDELPELGDLLNFSFITNELVKGIQEPAYTHQLAFTNTIEGKLFELPHNAKNTMMGEILVRRGVLTADDIEVISEKQKSHEYQEARFGEVAIREGKVSPHEVISALQVQKSATPTRGARDTDTAARSAATESSFIRVPVVKVEGLMDMLSELLILNSQSEQLASSVVSNAQMVSTLSQTAKLIREIQNLSMSLRLVEIRPTLHRLTRIARDTANELGKRVNVVIEGEETEIDRSAAERLFDPLMHLVRNAVSHGIEENVADRIRLGKKTEGQVTVRAYSRQGSVYVDVTDDGRGIDFERVLSKARRVGLADEYTEYSSDEIIRFLFMAGFSTQEQVNSISGRGVGMNVVEEEMRRLGGKVDVTTRRDEGSTFTLRIPMNLAVVNGTIVEISGERFIIPTLYIKEFAMQESYKWVPMQGRNRAIQVRNENVIPVLEPTQVFGFDYAAVTQRKDVVIMELEQKQLAFPVDRIIARQEIVSKPLDNEFSRIDFISGASILGDGLVSLILDVEAMFKAAGM